MAANLDEEVNALVVNEHAWRLATVRALGAGFGFAVIELQKHAATLYAFARARDGSDTDADAVVYQDFAASFSLAARHLHHRGEPGERFAELPRQLSELEVRRFVRALVNLAPALQGMAQGLLSGARAPSVRSARAIEQVRLACAEAAAALAEDRDRA